jgi:hypothetical protein
MIDLYSLDEALDYLNGTNCCTIDNLCETVNMEIDNFNRLVSESEVINEKFDIKAMVKAAIEKIKTLAKTFVEKVVGGLKKLISTIKKKINAAALKAKVSKLKEKMKKIEKAKPKNEAALLEEGDSSAEFSYIVSIKYVGEHEYVESFIDTLRHTTESLSKYLIDMNRIINDFDYNPNNIDNKNRIVEEYKKYKGNVERKTDFTTIDFEMKSVSYNDINTSNIDRYLDIFERELSYLDKINKIVDDFARLSDKFAKESIKTITIAESDFGEGERDITHEATMKVAVKVYSDYLAGYGKIAAIAQRIANRIYKDQEGFTKVINMKESIVDKEFEKFFG